MKKVSIVLPCYNHEKYIGEAIESVLQQTYSNFELFIFDNGSTDYSWNIIQKFVDPRTRKIRLNENNLLEVKRQFIEMASGEYFAIMHSDDIWMKEKLEKQMQFFDENKEARVCFTWSKYVDEYLNDIEGLEEFFYEHNKTEQEWWETFLERANHLSCPSLVCERNIYIEYFGKLYPYRQIADFYCWMKILEETNLYIVEEVLVNQRVHHHGVNMNESAHTTENNSRELLELKYIMYKIFDEMKDRTFLKYFCRVNERCPCLTHLDVLCQKFLFMVKRSQKFTYECDNVIRYYNTYFDYEENGHIFYQYLNDNYGFSRNDFFEYEGREGDLVRKLKSRTLRWVSLENTDFSTIKYPDSISIYGCGQIGKIFSKKIREFCHVEQFIDMRPQIGDYDGIPVVTLDMAKLDKKSVIVVIPSYDLTQIIGQIKEQFSYISDNNIIGFEAFVEKGKILDMKF